MIVGYIIELQKILMNIQFEFIKGFMVGIDYVDDIEIPQINSTAELIRISLGIFWINIFIFKDA